MINVDANPAYDAFKLLSEAKKYGARMARFGRKINNAENQLAFIRFLRLIADGEVSAEEAVRAYHGVLQQLSIRPHRPLEDDMKLQTAVMSYGGNGVAVSLPPSAGAAPAQPQPKAESNGQVDFSKMTTAQKVAYHKARWDRILG